MTIRTCSAIACHRPISMGATFCQHHWFMVPSELQMSIAGLSKRARAEGPAPVQHRYVYALLRARQAVAKAERRGAVIIPQAYRAAAENEQAREMVAA